MRPEVKMQGISKTFPAKSFSFFYNVVFRNINYDYDYYVAYGFSFAQITSLLLSIKNIMKLTGAEHEYR